MVEATARKPSILPGLMAAVLVGGAYAIGHFTLATPQMVALPGAPEEVVEEVDTTLIPRRYVSFPVSLTVNVPQWGTLLIDIGMAVNADLHDSVTDAFLTDTAPLSAPLSQAMLTAVEDPEVTDTASLQEKLPPLLRDALNGVIGTKDLPLPVLEVYLLKLITSGS